MSSNMPSRGRSPALLLLLAVLGCSEPLRLEVFSPWGTRITYMREVEEACEIIGAACDYVDRPYGAIRVQFFSPRKGEIRGWTLDADGCQRDVFSAKDGRVLAHELVHALGFSGDRNHVSDPNNVMYKMGTGTELTDAQQDRVDRQIRLMGACR